MNMILDEPRGRTAKQPFGLPPLESTDWLAIVCIGTLPLAHGPFLIQPSSALRIVLLVAALPVGLLAWARLAWQRDRAAIAASAFAAVALVSALLGPTPLLSVTGYFGSHSSVFLYVAVFAAWALARALSSGGRQILGIGLVATMVVNIVIGVFQIVLGVDRGPLATFAGRAAGFMGNAAFYASATVGVAAFAATRAMVVRSRWWLGATLVMSFGVGISGARGALLALLVVTLVASLVVRRRALASSFAVLVGLAGAILFTELASRSSSVSRLDQGGDGRFQVWRLGVDAWSERPVFGWGLGNHGTAVRPFFTEEFVRRFAWEDYVISWNDPHNILLNLLVSTGAAGVLVVAAFLLSQARLVDDWAFVLGFVATAMTWLLQPASVHSLPIGMVMLGAGMQRLAPSFGGSIPTRGLAAVIAVGVAAATLLTVTLAVLRSSLLGGDTDRAIAVAEFLPPDPGIADGIAVIATLDAREDPAMLERAKQWSVRPAEIEPGNPHWWSQHAARMLELGEYDDVEAAIESGLAINQWSASAWTARLVYANALRNEEMAAAARVVVCRLELPMCVTGPRAPDFSHVGLERSGGGP